VLGAMLALSQRFLHAAPDQVDLPEWRRRFVIVELITGLAWALGVQALAQVEAGTTASCSSSF
jgi:hypothetical protein